jgi:rubrerythrin
MNKTKFYNAGDIFICPGCGSPEAVLVVNKYLGDVLYANDIRPLKDNYKYLDNMVFNCRKCGHSMQDVDGEFILKNKADLDIDTKAELD